MYSGGVGSYCTAKRVVQQHGAEHTTLLFADTGIEDEDLYRFLHESSAKLGARLVTIADGRTPWELFHDRRFIGNSRVDLCSETLKRNLIDRWIRENYPDPDMVRVYVGIDWNEIHRYERLAPRKLPYIYLAPMIEPPLLLKEEMLAVLEEDGIAVPRLYSLGFAHNNCGGFCVKAGQAHFKNLLEKLPERYAFHEAEEEALRQHLGKPVAILRSRKGGRTTPITLRQFRESVEAGCRVDPTDIGGCGCALE